MAPIPLLIVRAGARLCALPASQVAETLRPLPAEPVGTGPSFVLGFAVLRGAPAPVVDLGLLLGDPVPGRPSRYVSVRAGDRHLALAVDGVLGVRAVDPSVFEALAPLSANGAVEAAGALDDRLTLLLRAARLVPDEAWAAWEKS